ncbi:Tsi3 family protein [Pseudomonas aeruginosa]|uniref:Tsi3 family protein n=1 Tax=Pseudomonas aeruginosa TaxID=287 RepID=UPI003D7683B3
MPKTRGAFPSIDLRAYAGNPRNWPRDNVRALASEYTSRPWDDNLSPGWPMRYKVEEDDGGSAGSEYRLWAAKPAGARWIVVSASEQSEDGEPTFALAWALLERARLQ